MMDYQNDYQNEIKENGTRNVVVFRERTDRELVEKLVEAVREKNVDLTDTYDNWLKVGFGLVNSLGQEGEEFFVGLSQNYAGYNYDECVKKYSQLMNGEESRRGPKVTIGSILLMAKERGIVVGRKVRELRSEPVTASAGECERECDTEHLGDSEMMKCLSDETKEKLPALLKMMIASSEKRTEQDMLVFGGVTALSVVMPKVEGLYDKSRVFPNLYMMTVGAASSGKGRLNMLRHVLNPVHREKRMRYDEMLKEYKKQKRDYQVDKTGNKEEPTEPGPLMLFTPGNSSAAALAEYMTYNEDGLMILETEGDTVANAFKSDFGDYSVLLRKAFHHEYDSLGRKTNREYREAEAPKVSIIISGTPGQAAKIFPSAENGLLSRFMFYYLPIDIEWKDVWGDEGEEPLENKFKRIGDRVYQIYQYLRQQELPIVFDLTREQKERSTAFFRGVLKDYYQLYGEEMISPLHRLGLIQFRIAMVLSVMRYTERFQPLAMLKDKLGQNSGWSLVCTDEDFEISMEMVDVALHHAARVFQMLPNEGPKQSDRAEERRNRLLAKLPREFRTKDAVELGDRLTMTKDAVRWMLKRLAAERKIVKLETDGLWRKL